MRYYNTRKRAHTKWRLSLERRQIGEKIKMCELCGCEVATDLHEIVNRVHYPKQMVDEVPDALLSLLCNTCNVRHADKRWARASLVKQNIRRYGVKDFINQVNGLADKLRAFRPEENVFDMIDEYTLEKDKEKTDDRPTKRQRTTTI